MQLRAAIRRTEGWTTDGRTDKHRNASERASKRGSTRRPNVASFLLYFLWAPKNAKEERYAVLLSSLGPLWFSLQSACGLWGEGRICNECGDFVISGRGRNCHCDCGFCSAITMTRRHHSVIDAAHAQLKLKRTCDNKKKCFSHPC